MAATAALVFLTSANALRALAFGATRCEGIAIEGAPDLPPDWAAAVREAREQLPVAGDCASFVLRVDIKNAEGARVVVTVPDGRRAERTVHRPADLPPTILGLVASIPQEPEAVTLHELRPAAPAPTVPIIPSTPPQRPESRNAVKVWLGVAVGARLGEPTHAEMLDLEARADVFVNRWLLFLSFRYAPGLASGADQDDQSYEETAIGVGAGRHETLGKTAIDFAVLPSLATMSFDDESGSYDAHGGTRAELRLGVSLRWSIPLGPSWRLGVTADTDVAPQSLHRAVRLDPDGAPLPAWTGGLRVGAAGALL